MNRFQSLSKAQSTCVVILASILVIASITWLIYFLLPTPSEVPKRLYLNLSTLQLEQVQPEELNPDTHTRIKLYTTLTPPPDIIKPDISVSDLQEANVHIAYLMSLDSKSVAVFAPIPSWQTRHSEEGREIEHAWKKKLIESGNTNVTLYTEIIR